MKAVVALLSVCLLITTSCTNDKLESDLKTANSTIQLLRVQVNGSNTELQTLREQINAANSTIQSLQQQVATGNVTTRSLQGLLTAAQGQISAANSTIQSLLQQLNTSNNSARTLQVQLTAANSMVQTLQGQLNSANATIQTLQDQMAAANATANATIQSLHQQLTAANAAANLTIQTLQQKIDAAETQVAHLNDIITNLSRIAPTPDNVLWIDYDSLVNILQTNEVNFNLFYKYRLVRMGQLKVVRVYDTHLENGAKIDLTSPGGRALTLVFKSAYSMEKLTANMTIIVYGTCDGSNNGIPTFAPDFVLVQIDSIP